MTETPELINESPPPPRKRGPLQRLGCGIALVLWFLLILSPCILFMLASRGELTLTLGSAPGQTARVWLVMEADERGLGYSWPTVHARDDGRALCVQTDVSFALWQGQAEPISYCECYQRAAEDASWDFVETIQGVCTADALPPAS
jgi:hypothetical protein